MGTTQVVAFVVILIELACIINSK